MEVISKYGIYGLGFFAQSLFGARLVVQLFLSEKKGKVVSPTIFWQLSLMASFLFSRSSGSVRVHPPIWKNS